MKFFVAAVVLLACSVSGSMISPIWNSWNTGVGRMGFAGPVMQAPSMHTATQYHSQDELGQASFGYAHPGQAAVNHRDAMGNQVGSYAYINPEGKEIRVSYVADSLGFRVISNDLPVGPVANMMVPMAVRETAEVAAARAAHMAAFNEAKLRSL